MEDAFLVILQTIELLSIAVVLHTGLIISVHLSARMSKYLFSSVFVLQNTSASLINARSTSLHEMLFEIMRGSITVTDAIVAISGT